MRKVAKKDEVAETETPTTAVAAFDYGAQKGAGFEGTRPEDLSIPFLSVLQANSPQVAENSPPGAKMGDFFDTVSKEIVDGKEGIVVVPCHKDVLYVQWASRDDGGGFIGQHTPDSEVVKVAREAAEGKRFGKLFTPSEDGKLIHELIETSYAYCLTLDPTGADITGFIVVPFTSTKLKPYRDWMTAMYKLRGQPPLFANRAVLRTERKQIKQHIFANITVSPLRDTWLLSLIDPVSETALLQAAQKYGESVKSGALSARFDTQREAGEDGSDGGELPF